MKTNEDLRRVANRIRDAYTLDEAEQILKQTVIDEIAFYKKYVDQQENWNELIQKIKQDKSANE